jgi:WD40 repeat protein
MFVCQAVKCVSVLDDCRLVSGSIDAQLRIWDINSGECTWQLKGQYQSVNCVAAGGGSGGFAVGSSPESWFMSGSEDNKLRLWSIEKMQAVKQLVGHKYVSFTSAFMVV